MSGCRSIAKLLSEWPPRQGALAFGQRGTRDWQRLSGEVGLLASAVRHRGGGRWVIATDDAYDVALGILATLLAGAVPVLPASLQPGHLAETAAGATGLLAENPPPDCTIPAISARELDPGGERLPLSPLDPDRAEINLHTSGTTGSPLLVKKPLRCCEAELAVLESLFGDRTAGAVIATVPPYHIYGLLFRVLWPLAAGRVMSRDTIRFPGELIAAVRQRPDAMLVSSPAFLKRAQPVLDLAELDRGLRGVFSSGGPLLPEVAAAYNGRLTHPVVEIYGSTETGGIGQRTVMSADRPAPWTPLPGVSVSLDPDAGVLMVASPFLPRPGWHRTGDIAELLPDGRFQLHGRADRTVKVEERRVSLYEIEQRLCGSSDVAAARVLRLAASERGRPGLGAVIVPTSAGWQRLRSHGKERLRSALRQLLRPHLDSAVLPRRWRFVRRLPENAHGKTSGPGLAALFDAPGDGGRLAVLSRIDGEGSSRLSLRLAPELPCFEGHFDGVPILAGVVQLHWAIRFATERFAIEPRVERVEALKFFRIIPAGVLVELELSYDGERLQFRYVSEQRDCSSGRVRFRSAR